MLANKSVKDFGFKNIISAISFFTSDSPKNSNKIYISSELLFNRLFLLSKKALFWNTSIDY